MTATTTAPAKKTSRKAPTGPKLTIVAPTPPETPVVPAESATSTLQYHVLFKVPHGSTLKLDGHVPARICVMLGRNLALTITGDPEMLSAIDLLNGDKVQGMLTLTYTTAGPKKLVSATLVIGGPSRIPEYELRMYADLKENYSFGSRERGHALRFPASGCILKFLTEKMAQPQKPARQQTLAA